MKLNAELKTYTYDMDIPEEPGFLMDVVETIDVYEVWIWHTDNYCKVFEYGFPKKEGFGIENVLRIMEPILRKCIGNYKAQYFTE